MTTIVYKICPAALWRSAEREGVFRGAPIDLTDGYIHFSTAEQVGASSVGLRDGTRAFTQAGTVTFHVPDPWLPALHRRRYARCLRVEVAGPGGYGDGMRLPLPSRRLRPAAP